MLVTPNWRVNPTPATARIDAVMTPNPIAGSSVLTAASAAPRDCRGRPDRSRSPADRRDLCRRHRADQHRVALHVLRGLERPGGVVPAVEHDGPAGADVLDLLAGPQRGLSGGEGAHDRLAGARLGDLHDVAVEDRRFCAL